MDILFIDRKFPKFILNWNQEVGQKPAHRALPKNCGTRRKSIYHNKKTNTASTHIHDQIHSMLQFMSICFKKAIALDWGSLKLRNGQKRNKKTSFSWQPK